jgi:hypothetical protein
VEAYPGSIETHPSTTNVKVLILNNRYWFKDERLLKLVKGNSFKIYTLGELTFNLLSIEFTMPMYAYVGKSGYVALWLGNVFLSGQFPPCGFYS